MDGLDDQAQAALAKIVEQLYTNDCVHVKHSSRDLVMLGLTDALKNPSAKIRAQKLILRSGISLAAMGWLEDALLSKENNIQELEFCSLQDVTELLRAFHCCQKCGIRKLTLRSFLSYQRGRHDLVSQAIRSGLIMNACENHDVSSQTMNQENNHDDQQLQQQQSQQLSFYHVMGGERGADTLDQLRLANISCIENLEIIKYPIGVKGTQILAELPLATYGLKVLKLLDCDIRSDSANYLAQIIRFSPKLQILDLSHNRQFRSKLTREMTIKTLVSRGLKDNLSLLHLRLNGLDNDINRSKLDRHLDINRLMMNYLQNRENRFCFGIHPGIWSDLLARVSVKPAALYFFLQQNITSIFG